MSTPPTEFERLLLELVRELKTDMQEFRNQVDKRFEQLEHRLDRVENEVDRRFEELKGEIRDIKHEIRADRSKLQEVYEALRKVKITFGWQWGMVSFLLLLLLLECQNIWIKIKSVFLIEQLRELLHMFHPRRSKIFSICHCGLDPQSQEILN